MKRSLYNQLISQASYPIILHNLVRKPLHLECNPNICYISNSTTTKDFKAFWVGLA
jgi:hypothetical protein